MPRIKTYCTLTAKNVVFNIIELLIIKVDGLQLIDRCQPKYNTNIEVRND